jgi:hypothetical protein
MPEWHLLLALLAALTALGAVWTPMLVVLPLLVLAGGATLVEAVVAARHAVFGSAPKPRGFRAAQRTLTAALHVLQPVVRLAGRLAHGLTFWRRRCPQAFAAPLPRTTLLWSERWRSPDARLQELERGLQSKCPAAGRGGEYDRWDLQVRGGLFGVARLRAVAEEHGGGRQLTRLRSWPVPSRAAAGGFSLFALIAVAAAADGALPAAILLATMALALALWATWDCAASLGALRQAVAACGVGHSEDGTMLETPAVVPVEAAPAPDAREGVPPASPGPLVGAGTHTAKRAS